MVLRMMNMFKKIRDALVNYFSNIGKELKEYFKNNLGETLFGIGCFVFFSLFFVMPKIMTIVLVTLFFLCMLVLITLLWWYNLQITLNETKYPYLVTTLYIFGWLLCTIVGIFCIILIDKAVYLDKGI